MQLPVLEALILIRIICIKRRLGEIRAAVFLSGARSPG